MLQKRICVVLETTPEGVPGTYTATFHGAKTLPASLDATMWYPYRAARRTKLGLIWKKHLISGKVQFLGNNGTPNVDDITKIKAAMKS
uniref:Uncharacterized protein n=1 Tax=Moniliophthora roreri TaxID=221103 RepID=A0A0W0EXI6_MONRR